MPNRLMTIAILCAAAASLPAGPIPSAWAQSPAASTNPPSPPAGNIAIADSSRLGPQRQAMLDIIADARKQMEAKVDQLQRQREDTRVEIDKIRTDSRLDQSDEEAALATYRSIKDQCRSAELTGVVKETRKQALIDAIDQLSSKAKDAEKDDPILAELNKILAAKADDLKSTKASPAMASSEIRAAEVAASEARLRVLQRRETLASSGDASLLPQLTKELAEVSIDVAAQKKVVEHLQTLSVMYEGEAMETHKTWEQLSDFRNQLAHLEKQIEQAENDEHDLDQRALDVKLALPNLESRRPPPGAPHP